MTDTLPWYVAGPLIGLVVPLLLVIGNRPFGISSNLRHLCAIAAPATEYLRYDWRRAGLWNLVFAAGVLLGGFLAGYPHETITPDVSDAARASLARLGIQEVSGLVPAEVFSWPALRTWQGLVLVVAGGFLIGFGTAWGGGCTSGHAITGMAAGQLPSVVATCSFFAGGLVATWLLLPMVLR
jgi:uncharacterized membrane protein YedE/YeeE